MPIFVFKMSITSRESDVPPAPPSEPPSGPEGSGRRLAKKSAVINVGPLPDGEVDKAISDASAVVGGALLAQATDDIVDTGRAKHLPLEGLHVITCGEVSGDSSKEPIAAAPPTNDNISRNREGGDDGGNDDGEKGPGNKHLEKHPISDDLQTAVERVNAHFPMEAVQVYNPVPILQWLRRMKMTDTRVSDIKKLQNDPELKKIETDEGKTTRERTRDLYNAEADVYEGFRILLLNLMLVSGYEKLINYVIRNGKPVNVMELAGGNCDIGRSFVEVFTKLNRLLPIKNVIPNIIRIKNEIQETIGRAIAERRSFTDVVEMINDIASFPRLLAFLERLKQQTSDIVEKTIEDIEDSQHQPVEIHPNVKAVDISDKCMENVRDYGVDGVTGDLCLPNEEFLEQTELTPNSQDIVVSSLALSRVDELDPFIDKFRLFAKPDGTTEFVIVTEAPMSPIGDIESKNENIPRLNFWSDSDKDPRRSMMGDRVDAIYNLCLYLNLKGLKPTHIAEQASYQVIDIDLINETAGKIRSDYPELKEKKFFDPTLNDLVARVFAPVGDPQRIPDDEVVTILQEYPVVIIKGVVTKPIIPEEKK